MNSVNYKVDLANEDHCGLCSEYRLTKVNHPVENPLTQEQVNIDNDEYIRYMM
jgi:hypothetical protein